MSYCRLQKLFANIQKWMRFENAVFLAHIKFWWELHVQIPPTGYVGLILSSIVVATTSGSIFTSSMRDSDGAMPGAAAEYPHSTLKDTLYL